MREQKMSRNPHRWTDPDDAGGPVKAGSGKPLQKYSQNKYRA